MTWKINKVEEKFKIAERWFRFKPTGQKAL